jgi:hypothetical protein
VKGATILDELFKLKTLSLKRFSSRRRGLQYDFFVSGRPLLKELEQRGYDLIPRLGSDALPIDVDTRDTLTLKCAGDLPSGRTALYVCPECGDDSCGVISVRIKRDGDAIVWSDFAFENDYDDRVEPLRDLGPFRFAESEYRQALLVEPFQSQLSKQQKMSD